MAAIAFAMLGLSTRRIAGLQVVGRYANTSKQGVITLTDRRVLFLFHGFTGHLPGVRGHHVVHLTSGPPMSGPSSTGPGRKTCA
jgi:hypothetical protein